ncbi:Cytochrome P450,Cytochrome P450, E-class, group I [Cinara cedri]|uniref:Cytochrome P450,Cytochrome P450, E-class, group I n=1 Tax=Cinara cedri TaxID=506608 RepID=A0A5E4N1M5_9HEMI|nr:Cytochrome P450,Cytochrome P450, E-class, group I [Cinara cedri]
MSGYITVALEVLAFLAFVVMAVGVPYVRRKRGYWTDRGVPVAGGTLATTFPGVRLNERLLTSYFKHATAAVVGLHDAGRPCALACDVRIAASAMGNDGFAEPGYRGAQDGCSLVRTVMDAETMATVMPVMNECVAELVTSLEAVANRRLTIAPWTRVRKCAATAVATCVYGQPMIDSRIEAFAAQCDKALKSPAVITDYFAGYGLSDDDGRAQPPHIKRLLHEASADHHQQQLGSDVNSKRVRSNMFEFVTGSIEPTAALVTATLYELALDQNLQNRLRKHLDGVLDEHQQQITIDQLDRLSYLENVLRETLRKYPLVPVVRRVTTKPYTLPPGSGGRASTLETDTLVVVPVHAFHHDGRHFAAPEAFRPDRFPEQLTVAYMPYGTGPRSYIGKHFVGLEAKLIIAALVSRYEVHLDSETGTPPNPFDVTSFAGVQVMVANRNMRDRESSIEASLKPINDKKFLFF